LRCVCSEDDSCFLSITEQRSGYQGAIRVHKVNREDPTQRSSPSLSAAFVDWLADLLQLFRSLPAFSTRLHSLALSSGSGITLAIIPISLLVLLPQTSSCHLISYIFARPCNTAPSPRHSPFSLSLSLFPLTLPSPPIYNSQLQNPSTPSSSSTPLAPKLPSPPLRPSPKPSSPATSLERLPSST
jgi:hypothetical protein